MNRVIVTLVVLSLAACATNPDKIASSYVSALEYSKFSCQELYTARARNERDVTALHAAMKTRSRVNTTAGIVGAVLFWPALFFMKDKDHVSDARLAELKGRRTAIITAMGNKGC